jgi:predicted DNA-binding transcriptional regulator YafY
VDALSQLGIPVVALPGPGGGYALPDGYWLAPLHLTSAEATVLLLGLQGLGDGSSGALGPARQRAEEKILAALRPGIREAAALELTGNLRSLPPMRQPRPEDIETLRRAIGRRGWVGARYSSMRRQSHHELLPLRLWLADGRWFCAAISRRTRGELTFRVERMAALAPIAPPPDATVEIPSELLDLVRELARDVARHHDGVPER